MTSQADNQQEISSSAVIAALKRRGYEVVEQTIKVCVFKSHDPEGYCVTLPAAGETLSAKQIRKILKDEPVDTDDVVSESFTQLYGDGPLVIDEDEVIRILRTTPHEKAVRTPDQLERMSKILNSVEEESKRVTERVNVSGNMDEYLN
ncbi:MAG: hypothetical protein QF898_09695 [SAR202 cluster bacterium]|jgi:predicted RNA binding protein YcfA (HicA-like mRNA interferase family)|nr:hypothetical protein [SAR202 cluster bacterium]